MNSMNFAGFRGAPFEYGVAAKYSAGFIEKMNRLYLLAYLVTADRQIAEWCLTSALDEFVEGGNGFLDWAEKEGWREVLRQAIRMMVPVARNAYWRTYQKTALSPRATAHQPFGAITSLSAFERFVFVMCAIEGLSEEEAAGMLQCTLQDVAVGRALAQKIIEIDEVVVTGDLDLCVVPTLLGNQVCGVC